MIEIAPMPSSSQNNVPLWLEYSHTPVDIAGTETPALTDFDEPIIAQAQVYALYAMRQDQEAIIKKQYADFITQERVDGEEDWDSPDQMADNVP